MLSCPASPHSAFEETTDAYSPQLANSSTESDIGLVPHLHQLLIYFSTIHSSSSRNKYTTLECAGHANKRKVLWYAGETQTEGTADVEVFKEFEM